MKSTRTAIVACKTLADELAAACEKTGCQYPIHWIESGLHDYPDRLRAALQSALDGCAGYARVLLAFGFCGNALAGVRTGDFELVVPRVDDCVSLLLGSAKRRAAYARTYFLTRGWLAGERTIWDEYRHAIEKYGQETGREILAAMLANYRYLGVIDTGCYALSDILDDTRAIARALSLAHRVLPGSEGYLVELITGPWDAARFLVFPPGAAVGAGALTLP